MNELPVTGHCSDYMKCLMCVMQIIKSGDLMISLNLKSMDCSLSRHVNTLWILCIQFSNIERLTCHVFDTLDFHWSQKENVTHFGGGTFFHCNVGSVMAIPKIC